MANSKKEKLAQQIRDYIKGVMIKEYTQRLKQYGPELYIQLYNEYPDTDWTVTKEYFNAGELLTHFECIEYGRKNKLYAFSPEDEYFWIIRDATGEEYLTSTSLKEELPITPEQLSTYLVEKYLEDDCYDYEIDKLYEQTVKEIGL